MKKIYIGRNDLFEDINMVLFNKIIEADESFIEDNMSLFYDDADDDDVNDEIARLMAIDWSKEEYKPYGIEETMTPDEIGGHLKCNHFDDIKNDLDPTGIEPYQYFACNLDDYQKEHLESWGVTVGYSENLDIDIIAIYDYGTSWSMFSYSKDVEDDYTLGYNETTERQTVY